MTWRDLWHSTLSNVRALLGAITVLPPPRSEPILPPRPPRALPGPVQPALWQVTRLPADPVDAAAPEPVRPEPVAEELPPAMPDPAADNGLPDGAHDDGALRLDALLESLLFVAAEPVEPAHLAQALGREVAEVHAGLVALADFYQAQGRGLRVQHFDGKVQLVTAPAAAPLIERFLNVDSSARLSGPALEALAVIAYRQPVTRAQIEAVRGVDCAGVLRSLVQRGLVSEVGRAEGAGRPILYGVTDLFMQHFGLLALHDLPPLEETEADRLWAATVLAEEGEPHHPALSP